MGSQAGNWEGLRKQARALENEIDMKLVSFSKLGTNYTRAANTDSDKQPLLGGAESGGEQQEDGNGSAQQPLHSHGGGHRGQRGDTAGCRH